MAWQSLSLAIPIRHTIRQNLTQRRKGAEIEPFWETCVQINEISGAIVDAAFKIHTTLGPGLLESVYEAVMEKELLRRGLRVRRQVPVPIHYDGLTFDEGFRADLIVEECIVVELKSVEQMSPVHGKQVLTYCKLLDFRLGLLINFGAALIKDGIKRVANGM